MDTKMDTVEPYHLSGAEQEAFDRALLASTKVIHGKLVAASPDAIRNAALEEAITVCDGCYCAEAIRALKT